MMTITFARMIDLLRPIFSREYKRDDGAEGTANVVYGGHEASHGGIWITERVFKALTTKNAAEEALVWNKKVVEHSLFIDTSLS
jgi:hypothetical protein